MDGLASSLPVSSPDSKTRLAEAVRAAVLAAFPGIEPPQIDLERPKKAEHGDFATNVALQIAKLVGRKPREAAEAIVAAMGRQDGIARSEIAGPGFINFTLSRDSRFSVVAAALAAGAAFGR